MNLIRIDSCLCLTVPRQECVRFLAPTGAQGMLMSVCPSGTKCSRAVNLHLSRSESTQKATREQSEHYNKVIQSEPKILRLVS